MSELDTLVDQEVEVVDPIRSFVDVLQGANFANAETLFNDILGDKVQDALDAEKIAVADQIFNGVEPEEMELDDNVESEETEFDDEEVVSEFEENTEESYEE